MKINFSVIIPVRHPTSHLKETLSIIKSLDRDDLEILVVTDKDITNINDPIQVGPAYKRNLAASKAKGVFLVFLDDDSYPHPKYFKTLFDLIISNPDIAGFCGPCLTPTSDNLLKQVSGLFWQSHIGSGGAGVYRNSVQKKRFVTDYPSVNLVIKKEIFFKVNGYQTDFWPGEDTLLCREITIKNKLRILYHPDLVVYHHRRDILLPHLKQISRYALNRGYFARKFPETSLTLGYLLPSLFLLYNTLLIILFSTLHSSLFTLFLIPDLFYFFLIILNSLYFFFTLQSSLLTLFLFLLTVPITHMYYGFLFIKGFLSPRLALIPHRTDNKTGNYIGG